MPDGPLAFLPFDILQRDKFSPYLCENFDIRLIPSVSISVLLNKRQSSGQRKDLLALGGVLYEKNMESIDRKDLKDKELQDLSREELEIKLMSAEKSGIGNYFNSLGVKFINLPGSLIEVKQMVNSIFNKKDYYHLTASEASEKKLKELSKNGQLQNYRIIHLSCHGYFDQYYPSFS